MTEETTTPIITKPRKPRTPKKGMSDLKNLLKAEYKNGHDAGYNKGFAAGLRAAQAAVKAAVQGQKA